jgi:aspartate aminotransferase-like enzyme
VPVRREVRRAFEQAPESHRSDSFLQDVRATKGLLCQLAGARQVELLMGSGTLANDVVAGQLSLLPGTGLVLSNGEFGERLVDHARRFGLTFDIAAFEWGDPIDWMAVRRCLERAPRAEWLWAVHCETSTGVLNDMAMMRSLCAEYRVKLGLDCMSSLGTLPVDLSGVYLASCSSSKGLRAYPGISMVFYNHDLGCERYTSEGGLSARAEKACLPRYLDLSSYAACDGVPFSFSSNLLHALHAAVKRVPWANRFGQIRELAAWLRPRLRELGFPILGQDASASPAVVTIALPEEMNSVKVGNLIKEAGYLLSYNSEYLRRRNWIQICLMGECSREKLVALLNGLRRVCGKLTVGAA